VNPTILFIQNYATDPPHLVGQWLSEIGFDIEVIRAFDGEEIPSELPDHITAVIALGGAMGALDDHLYSWLAPERALLAKLVDQEVPVMGICLGSQLLGTALGGELGRLEKSEIGVYEISQVAEDQIMKIGSSTITTQWHEDYVKVLPQGATLIADSPSCPTQIFKVGDLTYGLQSHPEADASIVALWEAKPDNAFKSFGQINVSSTVKASEDELARTWKPMIQRWGQAVLATLK
jgi:GMP synthase (glutamine-hydrolysing)